MFKPNKITLHMEINKKNFSQTINNSLPYILFLLYLSINLYIFPICNVFIWFL